MKTIQMPISQTVAVGGKKERKEVGTVSVTVPTLEDILPFVTSKVTGEEDGLPVYESEEANFIQAALLAYVKVNARNKVEISGDAVKIKDGLTIPTSWAEFTAEPTGRGGSAALALAREAKETFAKWASTLGKSDAAVATMVTLFSNRAALELQSTATKEKMTAYIVAFSESLDEATLEKLQKPIDNVLTAAAAVKDANDF